MKTEVTRFARFRLFVGVTVIAIFILTSTQPVFKAVLWKNTAKTLHDVTTDPSEVQNSGDVALPPGAKPFDSGFMPPGASWSYKFTVPGRYVYACIPHEKDHMVGQITVTK